jgi:hypothetical protein
MIRNEKVKFITFFLGLYLAGYLLIIFLAWLSFTPDDFSKYFGSLAIKVLIAYVPICVMFTFGCIYMVWAIKCYHEHQRWLYECEHDPVMRAKSRGLDFWEARKKGLIKKNPWFPTEKSQ